MAHPTVEQELQDLVDDLASYRRLAIDAENALHRFYEGVQRLHTSRRASYKMIADATGYSRSGIIRIVKAAR